MNPDKRNVVLNGLCSPLVPKQAYHNTVFTSRAARDGRARRRLGDPSVGRATPGRLSLLHPRPSLPSYLAAHTKRDIHIPPSNCGRQQRNGQ